MLLSVATAGWRRWWSCCLLFFTLTAGFSINLTVLDQTNTLERWPDLTQRVWCQNITDIHGQPLLIAADDVVLPDLTYFQSEGVAQGVADCQSMTVLFSGIRLRSFSNPAALILQLRWHDEVTQGPANHSFYQKSLAWPSNDYMWQRDYMGLPWPYEVTLRAGELGDDTVTRFNFKDARFLPPLRRLWVSLHAVMDKQQTAGQRINALYWVPQSRQANSTPLDAPLHGGMHNLQFHARVVDPANLMHAPPALANWSNASVYQQWTGPVATSNQLAWRLSFQCEVPSLPTTQPTAEPTAQPTRQPTAQPTATVTTTRPISERPPTTARVNETESVASTSSNAVGLGIGVTLACGCTVVSLCFLVRFLRRKQAMKRAAEYQQVRTERIHGKPGVGTTSPPSLYIATPTVQQYEYTEIPLSSLSTGDAGNDFLKSFYDTDVHTASDTDI